LSGRFGKIDGEALLLDDRHKLEIKGENLLHSILEMAQHLE
jgi:hypothetical protein